MRVWTVKQGCNEWCAVNKTQAKKRKTKHMGCGVNNYRGALFKIHQKYKHQIQISSLRTSMFIKSLKFIKK